MATAAFKAIGGLRREVVSLRRELTGKAPIDALTGFNERMIRARDRVVVATDCDLPVLIVGEAGSGRSDVGKFIHDSGTRQGRKPIVVTCGSGTPEQIELNFFGCAAGAFEGVEKARVGWLELARGSTLVLRDVEKLPLVNQRQLLQAVDAGTFWRRGGGTDMIELDVRFVGVSSVDPTSTEPAAGFDAAFAIGLTPCASPSRPCGSISRTYPCLHSRSRATNRRIPRRASIHPRSGFWSIIPGPAIFASCARCY